MQWCSVMKAHAAESYDEITRLTVLEPDGSVRPLPLHHTPPALDRRLREEVGEALDAFGFTDIGVEVADGRVILRGWVQHPEHLRLAARIVRSIAPEADIDLRVCVY